MGARNGRPASFPPAGRVVDLEVRKTCALLYIKTRDRVAFAALDAGSGLAASYFSDLR
jgi:hypothetical protein